jgi:hypothetical protein
MSRARIIGVKEYQVDGKKVPLEQVEYNLHGMDIIGERRLGWQYANEAEESWRHSYLVSFDNHTNTAILINADDEGDALDAAADFAQEMNWKGYFVDEEEVHDQEIEDEEEEGIERVGNEGWPVRSDEIAIFSVKEPPPATEAKHGDRRSTGRRRAR